jgi:hypothetical protein
LVQRPSPSTCMLYTWVATNWYWGVNGSAPWGQSCGTSTAW